MVAGPEISRLISQFEEYSSRRKNTDDRHHDNSMSMQKDFIDKVRSLKTVMNDYGNPFLEDSEDIYKIDSKDIVQAGTGKLSQIKQIGCNQYADFRNRMQNTASIYEPIKKNKFLLFSRQPKKSSCETKSKLDLAREDCSLFSRLFISCQSRQCDLEEFFSHENQKFPPSLSQSGKINIGVKSQLMEILEAKGDLPREEPQTDMVVVDGAAMVNSRPPRGTYTFDEYAKDVILPYIIHLTSKHARVDVIYDIYIENSLKAQTRKARGAGSRRKVVGTSKTPKAWSSFLRVDENKTETTGLTCTTLCSCSC
ncbi:unnamed protein product [Mytilus edulis]|uniref:Uncharacterized protein n=1 Tax=Mytilus edulis TaxID=6550 RepID=A0A8S3RFF4_MYTED|nr:unnamed protein product [Mytilus edulis]